MTLRRMRIILLCAPALSMVPRCYTQTDTTAIVRDSSSILRSLGSGIPSDSVRHTADTNGYHPAKDPWVAVGLSASLPGLGQIYNRNYWKVPVVWGLGGYWVYEW